MRFQDIHSVDARVFGARIRQARERLGLSQEELAARVSRDQAAISEYESGKRKVSSTDLPLLAAALDVSLLYFYEGEMTGHDLDQALLNEFHRLPGPETQQAAIDIVRIFSEAMSFRTQS